MEQTGCDKEEVEPTAEFVEDLGFDDLDMVEMVVTLEEAFCIEIPDEDLEFKADFSVKDAVDYLERRLRASNDAKNAQSAPKYAQQNARLQ